MSVPVTVSVTCCRIPVPVLAEAIALTAGATRMPPRHFLALSGTGNLLYAAVLCGNGAAFLPQSIVGPGLVIPMLLPVVAWGSWQWLARQRDDS